MTCLFPIGWLLVTPAVAADAPVEEVDLVAVAAVLVRDGHLDRAAGVLAEVDPTAEGVDLVRYHLLRGYFHGADDDTADELDQVRLASVTLPVAGAWTGSKLGDLALHAVGVQIISARRQGGTVVEVGDDFVLRGGDTLVLSGLPAALAHEK